MKPARARRRPRPRTDTTQHTLAAGRGLTGTPRRIAHMELYFLLLLILLMAGALASGFPVAFALPGAAILSIGAAALSGFLFAGDASAYFHQGGPTQWLSAGVTNLRGVYWDVDRDTLIAIPLFIFMGIMLQRSKIAEDLLMTMAQLFGPVRGGLGISVVFVGALLAATTGILGATVVAMGMISLPAMLRNHYSKALACGTIAASGTLGQIIPPSIVLIILADQLSSAVDQAGTTRTNLFKAATGELAMPTELGVTSTSAGEMFLGAFFPGLVLVLLYMVFILIIAFVNPKVAPAVPRQEAFNARVLADAVITLLPPLALIFLVLGSIIAGVATVNQAGAIGAAGAVIMAGYRLYEGRPRRFVPAILGIIAIAGIAWTLSQYSVNIKSIHTPDDQQGVNLAAGFTALLLVSLVWSLWRTLRMNQTLHEVMVETAKTTSLVFIILMGAALLTAAFRAFGGEEIVRDFLIGMPGGFWSQFLIVMGVIFLLGFFLDFIEIAVVVVPIVAPILLADPGANVTAVWLGVMIGLNIQTSFLTPPFGFALFYLRGVAPASVTTLDIYKGVVPFILLQLVALAIAGYLPPLINYLPTRVSLTSDTAPPPRNPALQYCLEEYVHEQFTSRGSAISASIESARALDLSYLPKKMQTDLRSALDNAAKVMPMLTTAREAEAAADRAAPAFAPLHDRVRDIEDDIRKLERRREDAQTDLSRLRGDDIEEARTRLETRIAGYTADIDALKAQIPPEWAEQSKAYNALSGAERKARNTYRRTADASFEPIQSVLDTISTTGALQALEPQIRALPQAIAGQDPAAVSETVNAVYEGVRQMEGAADIRSALSSARSALRARTPDPQKALAAAEKAVTALDEQLAWRQRATTELQPGLSAYAASIADTLGARVQPKLTQDQALSIAACKSGHRSLSLSF